MSQQDQYAYGNDEVDQCACPATTAGVNTHHGAVSKLAGRYDEQLRDGYKGFDEGTVSNDKARRAWKAAIEEAREEGNRDEVEIGELVVERLWNGE